MKSKNRPKRQKNAVALCGRCGNPKARGKRRCKACKRKRRGAVVAIMLGDTKPADDYNAKADLKPTGK